MPVVADKPVRRRKAPVDLPIVPGLRVRHSLTDVCALVIGNPESAGRYALVPVALEGSTRRELWPLHMSLPRPLSQQFVAMGGQFKPLPGYPLRTHH